MRRRTIRGDEGAHTDGGRVMQRGDKVAEMSAMVIRGSCDDMMSSLLMDFAPICVLNYHYYCLHTLFIIGGSSDV